MNIDIEKLSSNFTKNITFDIASGIETLLSFDRQNFIYYLCLILKSKGFVIFYTSDFLEYDKNLNIKVENTQKGEDINILTKHCPLSIPHISKRDNNNKSCEFKFHKLVVRKHIDYDSFEIIFDNKFYSNEYTCLIEFNADTGELHIKDSNNLLVENPYNDRTFISKIDFLKRNLIIDDILS